MYRPGTDELPADVLAGDDFAVDEEGTDLRTAIVVGGGVGVGFFVGRQMAGFVGGIFLRSVFISLRYPLFRHKLTGRLAYL